MSLCTDFGNLRDSFLSFITILLQVEVDRTHVIIKESTLIPHSEEGGMINLVQNFLLISLDVQIRNRIH